MMHGIGKVIGLQHVLISTMSSESAPDQGDASTGRECEGKKPPHQCFGCEKEYTRPHKRLEHMRDCCPDKLESCPTCGTGYTNEQGLKLHHSREHNESIAKVDIYCERCGDFYKTVYESSKDNYTYCEDCRSAAKSERMSGESNPMSGTGELIEYDCKYCGEHNEHLQSHSGGRSVFCDIECRNKWLSECHTGENNSMWNGGKEHYYGPEWQEQRQKALERDNHRCQSCGKDNEDATIALNVHHIQPYKSFDDKEKANELNNLVCLCLSCHNQWEGVPVKPQLL